MSGNRLDRGIQFGLKNRYGEDKSGKRYKKMMEVKDILKHDFNFMIFIIDEIL